MTDIMNIEVVNIHGQVILKEKYAISAGKLKEEFDLNRFAKGVYYLKMTSKSGILTEKVVVE